MAGSDEEGDSSGTGEPSKERQDEATQVDTPMLFEFVNNNDRSQIRRHAMRESWRQRNRGRSNSPATHRPKPREVLPRLTPQGPSSSSVEQDIELPGSANVEMEEDSSKAFDYIYSSSSEEEDLVTAERQGKDVGRGERQPLIGDGIFVDLRHTIASASEPSNLATKWSLSTLPTRSGKQRSPYRSLGDAEIDPFNSLLLSREDKELLFHWVHVYSTKAFGHPTDPVFYPIRDLFVAIDLGHPAFVHASLAHSASHIAFLRQERHMSIQALAHKMAAIRIINESLNDPVKAIGDENFSAVCRLLTFERYWGCEADWELHRTGLIQMINKRGGLSTFQSNWRLELRVHLISLMRKPRWNNNVSASSPGTSPSRAPGDSFDVLQASQGPHSSFVNFFSEITTVGRGTRDQHPAIATAIEFLRSPNDAGQEIARLMCLFYLAVIFKHARRSHFDLSWLNDSLAMTEQVWMNSVETLRWLLLNGMGRGPQVPDSLARTEKLAEVAKLLKENSWRRIEDRYVQLLVDGHPSGNDNAPWNSNMFDDYSDED